MTPSPDLMRWLHERVPLTLLIDLLPVEGPDSEAILRREGGDAEWLLRVEAA